MFVPLIYCIVVLWAFLFNPQWIEALPGAAIGVKQFIVFVGVIAVWCMVALGSIANERN